MKPRFIIVCMLLIFPSAAIAQDTLVPPTFPKSAGTFTFGLRNTFSLFSHGELDEFGYGMGGHFRIQMTERINTEWYLDVLTTDVGGLANRNDYHIGWSVMYYFIHPRGFTRPVMPFAVAGHCFDHTKVMPNGRPNESVARWSSAVQMGAGTHFNITPKLDFTLTIQYMMHLGNEVHAHAHDGQVHIEEHKNAGWEGHLLISLSANYKIARLWKSKKSS